MSSEEDKKVTETNRAELFYELAKGTFQLAGDDLIEAIILNLGRFFDFAYVATLEDDDGYCFKVSTCVYRAEPSHLDVFFAGEETVCAQAYLRGVIICEEAAKDLFKEDPLLKNKDVESIVSLAMRSPSGELACVITVGSHESFSDIDLILEVLSLFVSPAMAELEKRKTRLELEEHRALLDDVADSFPGAIFQIKRDPDGELSLPLITKGILNMDPEQQDFLFFEEALPESPWEFVNEEDQEVFEKALEASTGEDFGESESALDVRFRLKGQPHIWLRAVAQSRKEEDGSVLWSGALTDVSAQVDAERSLSLSYRVSDVEATVLDSTNRRQSLESSAETLCLAIESLEPGAICLLLLPEKAGDKIVAPFVDSAEREQLKAELPAILENFLQTNTSALWEKPVENSEWECWSSFLKTNQIVYAAGSSVPHKDSAGLVLVLFKKKPDFPEIRLQLALRRFGNLLRLVLQYCNV